MAKPTKLFNYCSNCNFLCVGILIKWNLIHNFLLVFFFFFFLSIQRVHMQKSKQTYCLFNISKLNIENWKWNKIKPPDVCTFIYWVSLFCFNWCFIRIYRLFMKCAIELMTFFLFTLKKLSLIFFLVGVIFCKSIFFFLQSKWISLKLVKKWA